MDERAQWGDAEPRPSGNQGASGVVFFGRRRGLKKSVGLVVFIRFSGLGLKQDFYLALCRAFKRFFLPHRGVRLCLCSKVFLVGLCEGLLGLRTSGLKFSPKEGLCFFNSGLVGCSGCVLLLFCFNRVWGGGRGVFHVRFAPKIKSTKVVEQ